MPEAPQSSQAPPAAPGARAGAELPKTYKPADHETRIWERWEREAVFHADPGRVLRGEARPYSMVIPPPNVTAALHLGHALNNSIQDILVRAHRMMGFETLWMPGTDHAGIATQAVVEKRVSKEEKKRRTDFTREEFIAKIQAFKDEYEATITNQLKKMGCSCDWERQRFTMDEVCARAVREAFFRLFKDGLIYRGKRLVNWDPVLQTAVADDECYDEEIDGAFYYLRYPLVHKGATGEDAQPVTWNELARRGYSGASDHPGEEPAWLTVATTRPETYLGDTAVGVNPHDPRAKSLRGLFIELPLVGRIIPIIEDDYVVLPAALARNEEERNDPKAGMATGFLKITPAHDPNDYEIGRRHSIGGNMAEWQQAPGSPVLINVFSPDGRISDKHGWSDVGDAHMFVGKKREEARKLVVEEFKNRGLLEKTTPHRHSVKHSDRSKAIIEPYLSDQWYVKVTDDRMAPAANRALVPDQRTANPDRQGGAAVASNSRSLQPVADAPGSPTSIRFFPARYSKTFEQWHDGIRDWCISRQLWWGHRIPVWHVREGSRAWDAGQKGSLHPDHKDFNAATKNARESGRLHASLDVDILEQDPGSGITRLRKVIGDPSRTYSYCIRDPDGADRDLVSILESYGCVRDPDVLDTWFSSALWPMSTMGWPDPAQAAKDTGIADFPQLLPAFNPTSCLCTAREIITLWVSRMTMFNRYFMPALDEPRASASGSASNDPNPLAHARGSLNLSESTSGKGVGRIPFHHVFIHSVIQDGEGRKMSKTLGNGVDPLDIIATHGADAMRFTLCHMTTQTQDVRMPVVKDSATGRNTSPKFDLGRNFCNKLWNAARYAIGILEEASKQPSKVGSDQGTKPALSLADRWLLSRLHSAIEASTNALAEYQFSDYAQTLYDILWRDFCDWYLEAIKPTVAGDPRQRAVLRAALDAILRLLHPIAPFVTEAIFERLSEIPGEPVAGIELDPPRKGGVLATAGWPRAAASLRDEASERDFERVRTLITAVREVRAQHKVAPRRRITLHGPAALNEVVALAQAGPSNIIVSLAELDRVAPDAPTGDSVAFRFESLELRVSNLADAVDTGAERARLEKLVGDLEKSIATLSGRLNNPGYAEKAPGHMVQQTRDQLAKAQADLAAARASLESLG